MTLGVSDPAFITDAVLVAIDIHGFFRVFQCTYVDPTSTIELNSLPLVSGRSRLLVGLRWRVQARMDLDRALALHALEDCMAGAFLGSVLGTSHSLSHLNRTLGSTPVCKLLHLVAALGA